MTTNIGFTVIYRWRLHPGMEEQFQSQWAISTERILREEGGLGSRLHRADDGSWIGYAQWPDRATWEHARTLNSDDTAGRQRFLDAIAQTFPPVLLTPVADFLVRAPIRVPSENGVR